MKKETHYQLFVFNNHLEAYERREEVACHVTGSPAGNVTHADSLLTFHSLLCVIIILRLKRRTL